MNTKDIVFYLFIVLIIYAIYKGKRKEHMATTNNTIDSAALQNIASLYNKTDP